MTNAVSSICVILSFKSSKPNSSTREVMDLDNELSGIDPSSIENWNQYAIVMTEYWTGRKSRVSRSSSRASPLTRNYLPMKWDRQFHVKILTSTISRSVSSFRALQLSSSGAYKNVDGRILIPAGARGCSNNTLNLVNMHRSSRDHQIGRKNRWRQHLSPMRNFQFSCNWNFMKNV